MPANYRSWGSGLVRSITITTLVGLLFEVKSDNNARCFCPFPRLLLSLNLKARGEARRSDGILLRVKAKKAVLLGLL